MNNRDFGVLLIPILAALAIVLPLSTGTKPPVTVSTPIAEQNAQPAPKQEEPEPLRGAKKLLGEFLGKKSLESNDLAGYELKFIIATVPDPIDSSLGYMFDRHVSAIQLAGQAAEYVPDRFDLPWRDKEDAAIQQGRAIARYKLDRLGALKSDEDSNLPRRQREPGVMLFRGAESQDGKPQNPRLLIVFLVGETPTFGIHKSTLSDAFKQFMELCGWGKKPECTNVGLLAPTFSGSADSLVMAMDEWPGVESRPKFEIVSGTATAISPERIEQLKTRHASFHATVWPDDKLFEQFFKYLASSPIKAKETEIAMLVERASAYGQAQITSSKSARDEQKNTFKPLILTYPLHISQLRKAAERAKGPTKELPTEAPSLRPRNLRLSLEETNEAKDIVSPFSQFEAFSVELVLSNILTTISREGIRYLGLFSTDVRDQIFLANKIRELAPNVVLFTSNADLIYLHSDVNLDFRGMLLITTYPLFSRNQLWTYPLQGEKFRLQFPTDTAQGVFNAALALLERPDLMLEYGLPFDFGQDPHEPRRPSLWLSVVGKNDIWPVKLLARDGSSSRNYLFRATVKTPHRVSPSSWSISLPTVFTILFLSIGFFLISLVLLAEFAPPWLVRRTTRITRWCRTGIGCFRKKTSWWRIYLGRAGFRAYREKRRLYLFSVCVTIFILSLIMNRILLRVVFCHPFISICGAELNPLDPVKSVLLFQPAILLVVAVLELPTLIVGIVLWNLIRSARRKRGIHGLRRCLRHVPHGKFRRLVARLALLLNPIAFALAPLLILVLALIYSIQINLFDPPDALFFYLRMLNLGSGLSPLLPVFFLGAGGTLWLVSNLRRLRLMEEFPARYLNLDPGSVTSVEKSEDRVRKLLTRSSTSLPYFYIVLLLVGVPCSYLFLWRLTPAIDGRFFNWVFGFTFLAVYVALALSFWRLLRVWWETRNLFRRLSAHPMQRAFKKLIKKFPRTPRLSFSNPSTISAALEFSVDQGRQLAASAARLPASLPTPETPQDRAHHQLEMLKDAVSAADHNLLQSRREETGGNWSAALRLRSFAQERLCQVAGIVGHTLKPYWASTTAPLSTDEQKWILLAEQFLAGRTAVFLHHLFLHLENLLFSVMAGLILMLLAVSSYPFQPSDKLLLFNWVVILATVVLTVVVFVQVNRNSVVSFLSGTDPGKVNWNQQFIVRLLLYGVVPVLALLGAQFPEGLKNIVSWFSASQAAH